MQKLKDIIRQAIFTVILMFCAVSCQNRKTKQIDLSNKVVAAYSISTQYFIMAAKSIENKQLNDSLELLGVRYRFIADSLQIEYLKFDVK